MITRFSGKSLTMMTIAFLLLSTTSVQVMAKVGAFSPTGSLSQARGFHSATLLKDGRVLVAGGFSFSPLHPSFPFFSSAEVYDPHTGTWSFTGSMSVPRAAHTATLLKDGRVLVAGGENPFGPIATAELYDPSTGIWSTTGSLSGPRTEAAALLLDDGRVLVAGGETFSGPVATAELYDPETGTWSLTGSMNIARTEIRLVPLADHEVLVAGGASSGNPETGFTATNTAEIYDTETGTWTFTGSMAVARIDASAVALKDKGMVLVAGGRTAGAESTPFTYLNSAELYDSKTGTWSLTGSMLGPHGEAEFATVVLKDGRVLLTGGFTAFDTPQSSAELYNPKTGTWTSAGGMSSARSGHTATLLKNGDVLVVGGLATPPTATATSDLFSRA